MTIGERIRELRKRNNMTQEQLAEKLCVSYQAVSKWECGVSNPDLALVLPLTKLFSVSADELLGLNEFAVDEKRKKYDNAYKKFRGSEKSSVSYWWAKEAVLEFPNDYLYLEWLANAEYQLAFEENQKVDASIEYFDELMENSLRRYEYIIERCDEPDIYAKAVLGKIVVLRFSERIDEAEWSAEFEYPDVNVKTAEQALMLCEQGQALIDYLKSEGAH